MVALWIMLRNVIVFVALAVPGYLLVKCKMLTQQQSGSLSKLLMYVGMPFLILTSTINNLTLNSDLLISIGIIAGVGALYTCAMFFATKPLTAMEKEEKTRGMMRFSTAFSNNGFLGIPLAMAVFGAGSKVVMFVIILNIITNILMYTLGIYLISGDKNSIRWKKVLLNPVLIAFVVGIVFNLLNVKDFVPEVSTFSTHFSNIVTPISMTILGMKMGGGNFLMLFKSWKTYYVAAVKLILFPVVIVALLLVVRAIFASDWIVSDMVLGCFIAFAMPTAGLASTFSDQFNGDSESAVAFTLGTTMLSIVTIPLLYWVCVYCCSI